MVCRLLSPIPGIDSDVMHFAGGLVALVGLLCVFVLFLLRFGSFGWLVGN